MTKASLRALAARCLEGAGPDRKLDGDLAIACGFVPKHHAVHPQYDGGHFHHVWSPKRPNEYDLEGKGWNAPHFTGSIDDALKLIEGPPEYPEHKTYLLDCATQTTVHASPTAHVWNDTGKHTATARTAPLAICAAALLARAATLEQGK